MSRGKRQYGWGQSPILIVLAGVLAGYMLSGCEREPQADPRMLGRVLGPGPEGRFDDYRVGGGVVRWSEAEKKWLMWYYGRDKNFPKDIAPTIGTGRISVATSDDGVQWTRYDGPGYGGSILEPSKEANAFDSTHVGVMDVTNVNGRWYLWYVGGDNQELVVESLGIKTYGYRMRAGVAVSDDGFNFEKIRGSSSGGAAVEYGDYSFVTWPDAIHDGEEFLLYNTVVGDPPDYFGSEVVASRDAKNWEDRGSIRWTNEEPTSYEAKGIMTRNVIENPNKEGKRWLMLYTALDEALKRSIMAAESDDGMTWTRLYDEPVFEAGAQDAWDGGGVATPQLVQNGDELRMYYFGFPLEDDPAASIKGIGLAISKDSDLRNFQRISH